MSEPKGRWCQCVFNLELTPRLRLPKEVTISNPRLVACYLALAAAAYIVVGIQVIILRSYMKKVPNQVETFIYPEQDSYRNMDNFDLNSTTCSQYVCHPVCPMPGAEAREASRKQHCMRPHEVVTTSSSDQEIGLIAAISVLGPNSTSFIIPGIQQISISVMYRYTSLEVPLWPTTPLLEGNVKDCLSVLLSADGRAFTVFAPDEDVIISLQDFASIVKDMPTEMIDGIFSGSIEVGRIYVATECYNNLEDARSHVTGDLSARAFSAHPICLVKFRWHEYPIPQFSVFAEDGQLVKIRRLYVVTEPGTSYWRYMDFSAMITSITSASVLLGFPRMLVGFFVLNGMGFLSRIYRRALRSKFELRRQIGEAALRLMAHHTAFDRLADVSSADGSIGSGISKARMHKVLLDLTKHRGHMDNRELRNLTNYCFERVTTQKKANLGAFVQELSKAMSRDDSHRSSLNSSASAVNIDDWTVAISSADILDFETVTDFFDQERHHSFTERLFTPATLKTATSNVRNSIVDSMADETVEEVNEWAEMGLDTVQEAQDEEPGASDPQATVAKTVSAETGNSKLFGSTASAEIAELRGDILQLKEQVLRLEGLEERLVDIIEKKVDKFRAELTSDLADNLRRDVAEENAGKLKSDLTKAKDPSQKLSQISNEISQKLNQISELGTQRTSEQSRAGDFGSSTSPGMSLQAGKFEDSFEFQRVTFQGIEIITSKLVLWEARFERLEAHAAVTEDKLRGLLKELKSEAFQGISHLSHRTSQRYGLNSTLSSRTAGNELPISREASSVGLASSILESQSGTSQVSVQSGRNWFQERVT